MAQRTRHSTQSQGDGTYPGIINQGYLSDYFLAYRLEAGLNELYRRWDERDKAGNPTPRTALRSLNSEYGRRRADAASTGVDGVHTGSRDPEDPAAETPIDVEALHGDAIDAQRGLNSAILTALGWTPQPTLQTLVVADAEVVVPVLFHRETASGLLMLAIETVFATDPTMVMASKRAPSGTLLGAITAGDRTVARTALEAAQVIFTAEQPPAYLLVCSGGSITLLDRERWGEGVFIGANLDEAVARADHRAKGELAAIAALFSADAIDPGDDAQSVLVTVLDQASNESAGVSKELRHGVRRSVELLAAAVVDDIRNRQKKRWQDIDADDLTRQCLRYLYRIIVLLFAEARPELGILPVNDTDYQTGYSVARLRDVALVDLHSELSANSTHIQQSLDVLFALVNDGYDPSGQLADVRSITFPGLQSALFGTDACPMLDRAEIPDPVMQQVMANLCFTQERRGSTRQSLSYATLGINQLGAVYEGLMAYRGFLATEALYEVDDDDDADTGTWVIPVSQADEYRDDVFVSEPGPDGVARRVTYHEGDFVFRLAGRDRQRSASYYTPEVLTEFTVRHALDVYEEEHPEMAAADWLAITVCEPALGSGAFANEAINQLAVRYLRAAQREAGETIDADRYQLELQRAKAHFAINRTYGVDLNRTAVELAEISLWLNVMHDGLTAPRFGARLRRGNSLIGARRATYSAEQVAKVPWKGTSAKPVVPPTDQPLGERPLGTDVGIHHFLVPGEGWGAAADASELKGKKGQPGLAEDWSAEVREWRKQLHKAPANSLIERAAALGRRVEHAWEQAARHTRDHLRAHERRVEVWGVDTDSTSSPTAAAGSKAFLDPEGPTARLRLIMDAWCALWMWAPANGTALPSWSTWLDAVELLLGQPTAEESGQLFNSTDVDGDELDSLAYFGRASIAETLERHPWLVECRRIAERQAFFHWELEFAPIFTDGGGFDLQVGNPPWVRPTWNEPACLAEFDPWWAITDLTKTPDGTKRARRATTLTDDNAVVAYRSDRAENQGLNALLASSTVEPMLTGIQTNLYMNFMTNTWRRAGTAGVVGLIHPESHFVDPNAGPLRAVTYGRLRRHWQFRNALFLFSDVHDATEFGVQIYGSQRSPSFVQAANLLSPATVDRSIDHDGSGETPAIQYPEGGWDLRPHAQRVVAIDEAVLAEWVSLFDPPGTPATESRLLRPLTQADLGALSVFARQPQRLGDAERLWTSGFHEKGGKDDGTFEWRTEFPPSLEDCILQGPHILNATPFAQQPRENCKSNKDWEALDLETLPADFVPRTNYQRLVDADEFVRRQTVWDGEPYTTRYREAHRAFVNPWTERTIKACIIPIKSPHLNTLNSIGFSSFRETVVFSGLLNSIPYDYLIKVFGVSHLTQSVTDVVPIPDLRSEAWDVLVHRALRLNCLTSAYADLWNELYQPEWSDDVFVAGHGTVELASNSDAWSASTPLRTDLDRWLALCEIDAIVSLLLGLTEEQLLQMYRAQFAVLRKNEFVTVFDANGRQISGIHHNHGFHQAQWEAENKLVKVARGEKKLGMWQRVQAYLAGETEIDFGPFVPPFTPADREAAMSRAYRAFSARLAES